MATPPRQTDVLWPDPQHGPWWVKVWWRTQHGVPTPVGISIRSWVTHDEARASGHHNSLPAPNDDVELPAVTGQLLRSLPMGELLAQTLTNYANLLNLPSGLKAPTWYAETAPEREAVDSGRRSGTRDLGAAHYSRVAQIYRGAVQRGDHPTQAVAEAFTISKSAAAKQVARARERGFLPETSRGVVGRTEEEL